MAGFGRSTTGIIGAGSAPSLSPTVESWNGSAWTEVAEFNTARTNYGAGGISNTSGVFFGGASPGSPNSVAATELWNGTAFTEQSDMATGRAQYGGGQGTASAGIVTGKPGSSSKKYS